VPSRLQVHNGGLDTLIEKCKHEQYRRQEDQRHYLAVKEQMEMAECTHTPLIKEAPDYVKRIAFESKMIREERVMIEGVMS
jgi:hypothetical protein